MRIGVISDTHRYTGVIKKVIKVFENPDVIIHLGDNVQDVSAIEAIYKGKIINVKGNCDFMPDGPGEIFEEIGGKKFFITHGHKYDVKFGIEKLKYRASELGADVVLFGHTHISKIVFENGVWYINPGSPSLPRDGINSVAVIDIENDNINACIKEV